LIKTRIAKRYARALFELAQESGKVEEIGRGLDVVDALYSAEDGVLKGLVSPLVSHEGKLAMLDAAITAAELDQTMGNFLKVLLDAGKFAALPNVAEEYRRMADEASGKLRGTATTPTALDAQSLEQMSKALSAALGKEVILESRQDPSIIGGVVARVGNLVFDASVRTQLQRMKESLVKG